MTDAGATALAVEAGGEPSTFRLVGELDLSTAPLLVGALEESLGAGGDVVLDVSDLAFMDSTGIKTLLRLAQGLEGTGSLVLRSPTPAVRRVVELTRIDRIPNLKVVE